MFVTFARLKVQRSGLLILIEYNRLIELIFIKNIYNQTSAIIKFNNLKCIQQQLLLANISNSN